MYLTHVPVTNCPILVGQAKGQYMESCASGRTIEGNNLRVLSTGPAIHAAYTEKLASRQVIDNCHNLNTKSVDCVPHHTHPAFVISIPELLTASHLMPKRLGDAAIQSVFTTFTGLTTPVGRFHEFMGITLCKNLDASVNNYHLGFWHRGG